MIILASLLGFAAFLVVYTAQDDAKEKAKLRAKYGDKITW